MTCLSLNLNGVEQAGIFILHSSKPAEAIGFWAIFGLEQFELSHQTAGVVRVLSRVHGADLVAAARHSGFWIEMAFTKS